MDTREVVLKGAELLNRYFGNESWKGDINVEVLDINHSNDCVLGQLFGSYTSGADELEDKLNLPNRFYRRIYYWPDAYGFNNGSSYSSFDLNEAWTEYLSQ